jgi:hypothetical protein
MHEAHMKQTWWLGCGIGLLAAALGAYLDRTASGVESIGGVLELAGVLTVLFSIWRTRAEFAQHIHAAQLRDWFRVQWRRLRGGKPHNLGALQLALTGHIGVSVKMGYVLRADETMTPEARLNALDHNAKLLQERVTEHTQQAQAAAERDREDVRKESAAREAAVQELRGQLTRSATGGLHIAAVGACWTFAGVVLSTWDTEIAAWLQSLAGPVPL